jgi:DNA-binding NtrC family response regulator
MLDKAKILIVDDEQSMLVTLGDILKILGYVVFTAENCHQAIELVKNNKLDLILMDFKMPGMNGVEVYREIRKVDSSMKVIFITAYYEENIVKEAFLEGVCVICHKPLDIPQLLDHIKAATGTS